MTSREREKKARELLTLARQCSIKQIDLMAHALGWPDSAPIEGRRGRTKWRNPYRNHYVTDPDNLDWLGLVDRGLAEHWHSRDGLVGDGLTTFRVTHRGQAVCMLALRALIEAETDELRRT